MATPAQAAAATVGAGSLAAAGAYGITHATKSEDNHEEESDLSEQQKEILSEPREVVTFELKGNAVLDTNYNTKVLAIIKKSNLSQIIKPLEAKNQKWWDWAFKHKYSQKETSKLDPVFAHVTKGFLASEEATNKTSLNQACEEAFKKAKTEFNKEGGFLVQNIGLFCTKGFNATDVSEPQATVIGTSVSSETSYTNKLAAAGSNEDKLVKVKAESSNQNNFNDLWWKWAFKNRFPTDKSGLSSVFSSVNTGYDETDNETPKKKLNHACDEAYKKDKAGLTNTNANVLADAKRFCTLTGNDELEIPST